MDFSSDLSDSSWLSDSSFDPPDSPFSDGLSDDDDYMNLLHLAKSNPVSSLRQLNTYRFLNIRLIQGF